MMPPEAIAAIAAAVLTSGGGVIAARIQARRALKAAGSNHEASFRDDLRADNQDLRKELREVKKEREDCRARVEELEEELRRLRIIREGRQIQDRDSATHAQNLLGDSEQE